MVYERLVDGGSTDVENWDSDERGLIEVHAETSERLTYEELKDDDR